MEKYLKTAKKVLKKCEQFCMVLVEEWVGGLNNLETPHVWKRIYTRFSTWSLVCFNLLIMSFARFPHSLNTTTNLYISKEIA